MAPAVRFFARAVSRRALTFALLLGPLSALCLLLAVSRPTQAAAPGETVPPAADLAVALAAPPEPLVVGAPFTYTLTITNLGPGVALSATAELTVSGAMLVVATGPAGSCTAAGAATLCALGDLAANAGVTLPLGLEAAQPGMVSVTVAAATASQDGNPENNVAAAQGDACWAWAEHQLWLPWVGYPSGGSDPISPLPPMPLSVDP